MSSEKKILIITYYWPPCGGAGVQRWLKFSKYLPEYGWEPYILTVDPDYAEYPAIDESLIEDVPPSARVFKTRAINYFKLVYSNKKSKTSSGFASGKDDLKSKISRFIRGNFFIPDPRRGWNKFAFEKAKDIIEKEEISVIISTGPPHSSHLIALKLKKQLPALRWISDFRDPWTDIYYYKTFYGTLPARLRDKRYEKRILECSDLILTIGEGLRKLVASKSEIPDSKIRVISNGYDEDDFAGLEPKKQNKKSVNITYVGSISDQYPIEIFIKALGNILSNGKVDIRLRLVGNISGSTRKLIETNNLSSNVEIIDYSNHKEAIEYMLGADILLLLIPGHIHNEIIITGKLFEYLRSEKPIILLGPSEGDAARILKESDRHYCFEPDDYNGISNILLNAGNLKGKNISKSYNRYERRLLGSELAEILNKSIS